MHRPVSIVMIIESDPRTSHRPAEAIRIVAGVGVWQKVMVHVCLRGPAVLALGEQAEGMVDGDCFRQYLPLMRQGNVQVWIQPDPCFMLELEPPTVPCQTISNQDLAALTAQAACTFHF